MTGGTKALRLSVPGRLCLFGEHSDWAGAHRASDPSIRPGRALITGTNQQIHATVRPHPDSLILSASLPDGTRTGPRVLPMNAIALRAEAEAGGFWSYAAGVALAILQGQAGQGGAGGLGGLVLDNDRTDLPVKKGLSSSAAICVLAARAFNRLYGLGLSVRDEMEIAYRGETATPSRCGRMDQGCAFGRRTVLMTFDGDALEAREVPAGGDFHLVVVDLGATKDTIRILAALNAAYPVARDERDRRLHRLLGAENERIVLAAVDALRDGDAARLGALMGEAQEMFDRDAASHCREELSAPRLHRVLSHAALEPHVWGGKGVGSQGDGVAQLVARSAGDQRQAIEILARDLGMDALPLTIRRSSPGGP